MMLGRTNEYTTYLVPPIIVGGNGYLLSRMLSILGCDSSGQGLALMRNVECCFATYLRSFTMADRADSLQPIADMRQMASAQGNAARVRGLSAGYRNRCRRLPA